MLHNPYLSNFDQIGKDAPALANKFSEYYQVVFAEGELTERKEALICTGGSPRRSMPILN
jgi:hypothetical protein